MMESLALKLARAIKNIDQEKTASIEVLKFSLEGILNVAVTAILVIVVGLITGNLFEALIGLISFAVLRFVSGGVHLQKSFHCSLITTLIICLAPLMSLNQTWFIVVTGLSLILLLLFAPSNIEGHARLPKKFFPLLKLISLVIVSSNFLLNDSTIAIVFLAQSVTTIPILNKEVIDQ